jgi:hypothetical protein
VGALTGAFFIGRCSQPEHTEKSKRVEDTEQQEHSKYLERSVPDEGARTIQPPDTSAEISPEQPLESARPEEFTPDEKCRDFQLDIPAWRLPYHPYEVPIRIEELEQPEHSAPEEDAQTARPDTSAEISPEQPEHIEHPEKLTPEKEAQVPRPDISAEQYTATCGGGLMMPLRETVAALEAKSIRYGIGPLSDCSGIFHRVLRRLKQRCPGHYYPSVTKYRDSRDLARWYHERGELVLIENALDSTGLIRPGTVLFFGRKGSVRNSDAAANFFVQRSGIRHMGIVIRVHKNKSGEVISYDLFHGHGRKGKTAASTTGWHKRNPTRSNYPPFGNGRQQLIAAAPLLRPVINMKSVEQLTSGKEIRISQPDTAAEKEMKRQSL